jgi:hypothetical protein
MRYIIIALILAVIFTGPIAVRAVNASDTHNSHPAVMTADGGITMLDGIDWDEWLESIQMLDGIDWDEWLESLIFPTPRTR